MKANDWLMILMLIAFAVVILINALNTIFDWDADSEPIPPSLTEELKDSEMLK